MKTVFACWEPSMLKITMQENAHITVIPLTGFSLHSSLTAFLGQPSFEYILYPAWRDPEALNASQMSHCLYARSFGPGWGNFWSQQLSCSVIYPCMVLHNAAYQVHWKQWSIPVIDILSRELILWKAVNLPTWFVNGILRTYFCSSSILLDIPRVQWKMARCSDNMNEWMNLLRLLVTVWRRTVCYAWLWESSRCNEFNEQSL